MTDQFEYSGRDNLEVMLGAKNYNSSILKWVEKHCAGATRVVDFGAGIGTFSSPFRNRVVCVEPDALNRLELKKRGLRNVRDLEELEEGFADAIFSINVLEHVENDAELIRILTSKLQPSGRLLIYVPAMPILFSEMDRKVGHYRRYERRKLASHLEGAGLEIRTIKYVDTMGVLATLMYKLTRRTGGINPIALFVFDRFIFPMNRLLDPLFGIFLGKNLAAVAVKPPPPLNGNTRGSN
jgi:SAM-dependent methyltransferase